MSQDSKRSLKLFISDDIQYNFAELGQAFDDIRPNLHACEGRIKQ